MAKKQPKKRTRESAKNISKSANFLAIALVIIVAIGLLALALSFFKDRSHEITKSDVFANNISSKDVEFFGLKLGDSISKVRSKMGKPDFENNYTGNVVNLEYEYGGKVGILFHTESGILTSVTLKEPFNKYLKGTTRIQYTKEDMLRKFGTADNIESIYPYRVYTYDNLGVKFIIDRDQENGMIFFF